MEELRARHSRQEAKEIEAERHRKQVHDEAELKRIRQQIHEDRCVFVCFNSYKSNV